MCRSTTRRTSIRGFVKPSTTRLRHDGGSTSSRPDTGPESRGWHSIKSPSGELLRYFGLFSPKMPDLDFDNKDVRREVEAIARFWLDLGVDGFRLDAAKHIYGDRLDRLSEDDILKNNEWWREFSHFVYRTAPNAILMGEVLGDPEMLRRHAWGLDGLRRRAVHERGAFRDGAPGARLRRPAKTVHRTGAGAEPHGVRPVAPVSRSAVSNRIRSSPVTIAIRGSPPISRT